jgi:hypothetical protein
MNLYVFNVFSGIDYDEVVSENIIGVIAEDQDEGIDIIRETKDIFIPDFEDEDWILLYQTPVHNQIKQIVFQGGYVE